MKFIEAIAHMEGFYVPGTLPARLNNPGDICAGHFTAAHGGMDSAGRFAKFATAEAGFAALRALLCEHYAGLTVGAAISKYAPAVENDTARYVSSVCKWTGLTPETVLTAESIG